MIIHIRTQRWRDCDIAVLVLIVFHDGDERAADGEAGAVERVQQFRPAGFGVAPAGLHAPRLKGLEVAAG